MVTMAYRRKEQAMGDQLNLILRAVDAPQPPMQLNWNEIASRWLDLIRPIWYDKLCSPRDRPLLLKDIRSEIVKNERALAPKVLEAFASMPLLQSADERVAVCIIGVK